MKKLFLAICVLGMTLSSAAQNSVGKSDDGARIALTPYIPAQIEGLTPAVKASLSNKLSQIATANGLGGSSNSRFIITTNVSVLTKDITPTAPPMHAYTLEVTLYIGDGLEGTLFSSQSVTLKGVGVNETKAYIAALNGLKTKDPVYQTFIEKGKNKIMEYFNSKCDFILKDAQTMAAQNKYEEAIMKLTSVPEVCKACYDKAMDAVAPIYQKQIDRQCKQRLMEATTAWNAAQDLASAENAGGILSQIEPGASCYKEALALSSKIAQRVKELDQREWKFQMKQQQDDVDIQKATIKAARDIGVAYGNNQPDVVYKVYGWW
ncbi:MAG: hypothetical protein FGM16_01740 [Flavobacterium sp.]|nr:hypothetical protein [Flavobacterium sp.]